MCVHLRDITLKFYFVSVLTAWLELFKGATMCWVSKPLFFTKRDGVFIAQKMPA